MWYVGCYGAQSAVRDEQLGEQYVLQYNNPDGTWRRVQARVGWERILRLYYDSLSPTGTRQQRGSGRAHTPGPQSARARRGRKGVQGKSESRDMGLNIHVYKVAAGVAARPQLCQQLAANPNPRETSDGLRLPWSSPATSTVLTK